MLFRLVLIIFMLVAQIAWADDFSDALKEYNKGNYSEAFRGFLVVANRGDAAAQFNLGNMYNQGKGVPQDYQEAVKWYRLAAQQGVPSAQFNLGLMYSKGQGVPQDYQEAAKWFRLAADQGHVNAQMMVGAMYVLGRGVDVNLIKAHMWFNIAAANGNEDSSKLRDELTSKMTKEQINKAQSMAKECVKRKYRNCN